MENEVLEIKGSARYFYSRNRDDMDVDLIHHFLHHAYWSKGISRDIVERAIQHSLCVGIFTHDNKQMAFARALTDAATVAYLADVFVLPEHRGLGIAEAMLKILFDSSQLQGLRRMMLATSDAHGLYEKFGFKTLATPEILMEKVRTNLYLNT